MNERSEWIDVGYDELDESHAKLILECINALDDAKDTRRLAEPDGRILKSAEWVDDEDRRCYLKAYPGIDPQTRNHGLEERKFITHFYFLRQTSYTPEEWFYFTSQPDSKHTGPPAVRRCDADKVPIDNETRKENLTNLTIVLKSITERSSRTDLDGEMKKYALDCMMGNKILQFFVKKMAISDGVISVPMHRAVNYVIQKEPILSDDYFHVQKRIEQEMDRVRSESGGSQLAMPASE